MQLHKMLMIKLVEREDASNSMQDHLLKEEAVLKKYLYLNVDKKLDWKSHIKTKG